MAENRHELKPLDKRFMENSLEVGESIFPRKKALDYEPSSLSILGIAGHAQDSLDHQANLLYLDDKPSGTQRSAICTKHWDKTSRPASTSPPYAK